MNINNHLIGTKLASSAAFLLSIIGANWALATFGIVPLLGTSMMVPAGAGTGLTNPRPKKLALTCWFRASNTN
jgi:hypothetical protein